jgi:cell division protein FtsB
MKSRKYKTPKVINYVFWAILLILTGWILLWGTNSFYNTHRLRKELVQIRTKVDRLVAVNDSLRSENEKLSTSLDAAEKAARERFGLVKPGEKVFRFIQSPDEE